MLRSPPAVWHHTGVTRGKKDTAGGQDRVSLNVGVWLLNALQLLAAAVVAAATLPA